jgi:hypothetical protein
VFKASSLFKNVIKLMERKLRAAWKRFCCSLSESKESRLHILQIFIAYTNPQITQIFADYTIKKMKDEGT